jgi:hypothetical protein
VTLQRHKSRSAYCRLHKLTKRIGYEANVKWDHQLYLEERFEPAQEVAQSSGPGLRSRNSVDGSTPEVVDAFLRPGIAMKWMRSILSAVDGYSLESDTLAEDFNVERGCVTRVREGAITERGRRENVRSDRRAEFRSRRMISYTKKEGSDRCACSLPSHRERENGKFPRKASRRVTRYEPALKLNHERNARMLCRTGRRNAAGSVRPTN